jgi:hypothetical protein
MVAARLLTKRLREDHLVRVQHPTTRPTSAGVIAAGRLGGIVELEDGGRFRKLIPRRRTAAKGASIGGRLRAQGQVR